MLTTYEFAAFSISEPCHCIALVGGLRGTQIRIVGVALKMEGFCHKLTECNLQLAKNVRSGALDEVVRQRAVFADHGSLASMPVRG